MTYHPAICRQAIQIGFSLVELMVVVAIIAILTTIALPAYSDYVQKSRLVEATNALSGMRAQMEQHFQDNRTYATSGNFIAPCQNPSNEYLTAGTFTVGCSPAPTATAYTLVATGSGSTAGFSYSIDQNGTKGTQSPWGNSASCWILNKAGLC